MKAALRAFLSSIGGQWLAIGILAVLLVLLAWCAATAPARERQRLEAALGQANAEATATDSAAREAAADQRLTDHRAIDAREETLTDAVAPLPDARPSDRRHALACARMRVDPRSDQAAVSAVCGAPPRTQAALAAGRR